MIAGAALPVRLGRAAKLATTPGPRLASAIASVLCLLPVWFTFVEFANR
jgi:hypothetical protein